MITTGGISILVIGNHLSEFENEKQTEANLILSETWDALRAIRNNNWENIVNGTHGLSYSSNYWGLSGSSDDINGITRQIIISDVRRNLSGDINFGGDIDSDSKSVQIIISWSPYDGKDRLISLNTYLNNYKNPAEWP